MRVINVVEITDGVLLGITSFGVVDEQLSYEVVEEAEDHYVKCCRENGATDDEYDADDLIDMETYQNGNYSVSLYWTSVDNIQI